MLPREATALYRKSHDAMMPSDVPVQIQPTPGFGPTSIVVKIQPTLPKIVLECRDVATPQVESDDATACCCIADE